MLIKFDTSGRRIWGTYVGDDGIESSQSICQDEKNNIYILGQTNSLKGIASSISYQTTFGGGNTDVFLMKFSSTGSRQWGTYFGGVLAESGGGICADKWDNIYVCGNTRSSSQIADTAAFQNKIAGLQDAFIAAFKPNGKKFWSSYYGGESWDYLNSITSDGKNLYMTGSSSSQTLNMATKGSLVDTNANGREKGLIVKISEAQLGYTSDTLDPVSITDISAKNKQYKLYPNPNKGNFTFEAKAAQNGQLSVVDILGKIHWSEEVVIDNAGNIKQNINLKKLAAGIYFLHFTTKQNTEVIEFLKD